MATKVLKYNVIQRNGEIIKPCADPDEWVSPEIPYSAEQLQKMVDTRVIPRGDPILPWATRFRRGILGQSSLFTYEQFQHVTPVLLEDLKKEGFL